MSVTNEHCAFRIWTRIDIGAVCDTGVQTWRGRLLGREDMVGGVSELAGICVFLTACILSENEASDHRLKHVQEVRAGGGRPRWRSSCRPSSCTASPELANTDRECGTRKHLPQPLSTNQKWLSFTFTPLLRSCLEYFLEVILDKNFSGNTRVCNVVCLFVSSTCQRIAVLITGCTFMLTYVQKPKLRAGELAQPGTVSGAKPEDMSSIPCTHLVEGENQIVPQFILWCPHPTPSNRYKCDKILGIELI